MTGLLRSWVWQVFAMLAAMLGSAACAGNAIGAEARTVEYRWFNEGAPAGEQTVIYDSPMHSVTDMRIRWNNRDFILRNEMQFDEEGYVTAQRLTGQSAFGATIDESFELDGTQAHWRSTSESGSKVLAGRAFYVPGRTGATEAIAALIRRGLASGEETVPLLPAGEARVTRVTQTTVMDGDKRSTVTLYSVAGLEFAPTYAWLDEQGQLFSHGFWGLSLLPEGWSSAVAEKLARIEARFEEEYYEAIAQDAIGWPSALVIEQVDVFDVTSGRLIPDQDVVVSDGKIVEVSDSAAPPQGARQIDGQGKVLLPGLWDMHAHTDFFSYHGGILNIAAGVTSVRDMGSDHDAMMQLSRRFDAGELVGPAVYRAGFIDKASPFSASRAVETLEEAMDKVNWYADHGYIQIKLYSSIAPEWVRPLTDLAHRRGLRVSGHVPAFMNAEGAVRLGFDEIQHINMLFLNFIATKSDDTRTRLRFYLYGDEAGNLDLDSQEVARFVELLEETDTVVDPTAAVFDSMIGHRAGEPDPMFVTVVKRFPIGEFRSMHSPGFDINEENAAAWDASRQAALRMIRKLHEAGVQLVPGTDALPGFALHRELELYAAAGIPNAEVLQLATIGAARVAGADAYKGSIEEGKVADMVLLAGNPLDDIGAIRRVELVVRGGATYRPAELHRSIGIRPGH